ncbi:MAG: CDP-alcohol phosphatidyltransferase family protein [Gemmatimonadota bacterium]|nr:CDP-alcohol phosphatidyltransferase family protein [Gemmatimonadota bacterium]
MFDHWLRSLKDRLFAPVAARVARWVHPNVITVLALAAGLAAAGLVARGASGLALLAWLVNRILDGLDGSVARAAGRQSDFGGYLDIVLDFVVYAAIPVGIILHAPSRAAWLGGLFLLASFYINAASWMYLASILERRSAGAGTRGELTTITMPPGIIAGTETILFYTAFLLMPARAPLLFLVMGGLVIGNVTVRLVWAARALR